MQVNIVYQQNISELRFINLCYLLIVDEQLF